MGKLRRHFELHQVVDLAHLSRGMVDYLCRHEIVIPGGRRDRGKGKRRRYTFADLVLLRALSHLLKCGVSVARLKVALKTLQDKHDLSDVARLPGRILVTDGVGVYLRDGKVLEDLTAKGQFALAFVQLELISQDLTRKVKALDGRPVRSSRGAVRRAS